MSESEISPVQSHTPSPTASPTSSPTQSQNLQEHRLNINIKCTENQYDAIMSPYDQPNTLLNIIAPPGSGKTLTLCKKISYILSEANVKPEEILILSLTNRSVDDIRVKLLNTLNFDIASSMNVYTFHSFANVLLSSEIGNDWQLIDDEHLRRLGSLITLNTNPTANSLTNTQGASSLQTKKVYTTSEFKEIINSLKEVDESKYEESLIYKKYNFTKETFKFLKVLLGTSNIYTYDSMLEKCNYLLSNLNENENIKNIIKDYKIIIVDEFQDVYSTLTEIIIKLSTDKHLIIAGDPNQSIYGFLGATRNNNWGKLLPIYDDSNPKNSNSGKRVKTIKLNQTFRSTPEILQLSNSILNLNNHEINTVKSESDFKPIRIPFKSPIEEYKFIHSEIERLIELSLGEIKPSDIAILSYSNKDIDAIYNYFNRVGKFQLNRLNTTPRWIKTKLLFILHYLRILINPNDNFAFYSCLNLLPGIGKVSINSIYLKSLQNNISIWEYLHNNSYKKTKTISKNTFEFIEYIKDKQLNLDYNDPVEVFNTIIEMSENFGLKKDIKLSIYSKDNLNSDLKLNLKINEYKEFLKSIFKNLKKSKTFKASNENLIQYFLHNYSNEYSTHKITSNTNTTSPGDKINANANTNNNNSNISDNSTSNVYSAYNPNEINFSTIHSAKGLEFPVVFILSNNENLIFSSEKRRVLYVGITRASSLLYWNKLDNHQIFNSLNVGSKNWKFKTESKFGENPKKTAFVSSNASYKSSYTGNSSPSSSSFIAEPPVINVSQTDLEAEMKNIEAYSESYLPDTTSSPKNINKFTSIGDTKEHLTKNINHGNDAKFEDAKNYFSRKPVDLSNNSYLIKLLNNMGKSTKKFNKKNTTSAIYSNLINTKTINLIKKAIH
ncbi:unnamed protein product [[Candida] boidinii]|uniref:DNA 3'-5' helicase n=1 Tax=Candida boidinii TaxID=5477 RepID=A0A9W6SX59_CANBO|nr:hydrolase activity protein [[Candida] boidinii]OWB85637.1 hydrolase activity protein [[Candida] boidinii]GME67824.1 unnamed protein product [[Candida] boidinii]GMF97632.1 unnamed protein product [[Candida] boidinii]